MNLSEIIAVKPIVPYIRESDFAIRSPWSMPIRRLLDYLLIYVQEGNCVFTVDGTAYRFGSGEFCFIQPGSLNELEGLTNTVTPFAHFDIFYNPNRELSFPTRAGQIDLSAYGQLLQPRLDDIDGLHVPVRLVPRYPVAFRDTFLQMVECWQHSSPLLQLKAQSLATQLVLAILEEYAEPVQSVRTEAASLNWITSFLSFRLAEPLSVKEMARRANLSPSRFHTVFKQRFGMPPHRYLLELRIRHAKELLVTTDLHLEDIAGYCGFADIHHFSKTFRRNVGIPPGVYRQRDKSSR